MNMKFETGINLILDVANAIGGKLTDLQVADIEPGFVMLFADITVCPVVPIKEINISFEVVKI